MSIINNDEINHLAINSSDILIQDINLSGIHLTRGVSKLIEQFKDKPILKTMLAIFLSELDEIENTLQAIVSQRIIENAVGFQLDVLGEVLGRSRGGFDDSTYRKYLRLQIGINTSKGEAEKILTVWKTLTGANLVSLSETFPAAIELTADTSVTDPSILDEVERVLATTVALSYIISNGSPFCFEGGEGEGFGTTDDSMIGGSFVSRIDR